VGPAAIQTPPVTLAIPVALGNVSPVVIAPELRSMRPILVLLGSTAPLTGVGAYSANTPEGSSNSVLTAPRGKRWVTQLTAGDGEGVAEGVAVGVDNGDALTVGVVATRTWAARSRATLMANPAERTTTARATLTSTGWSQRPFRCPGGVQTGGVAGISSFASR